MPLQPIKYCYWVEPGKLLAGEYPRNKDKAASILKIQDLKAAGVSAFIDLTEADEGLAHYDKLLGETLYQRFPLPDVSVPDAPETTSAVLDAIDEHIRQGRIVYIHCWGGVGRTGVMVGCWLARHGNKGQPALDQLRTLWKQCPKSAWRKSPDSKEQADYIRRWEETTRQKAQKRLKNRGLLTDQYKIIMHGESFQRAALYQKDLAAGKVTPGTYLNRKLGQTDISQLMTTDFIELIVRTKKPQIFAESAVFGDGTDWNQTELSLLGDMGICVPVQVFDNGLHNAPDVHESPFGATLLYVPGALLMNCQGRTPADWKEVTNNDQIDADAYNRLYERRLLPSLLYANKMVKSKNRQALITIPGIGCGQFAGKFWGQLEEKLKEAIITLLEKHGQQLTHIKAVYYDPYKSCTNERNEINQISFLVRPLAQGNEDKPQLCLPAKYADKGDDFSDCDLFSFVAWDHVSWPGNDFYTGSRATDDGVKAAATDSMTVMTGVEGRYDVRTNQYNPPGEYRNWNGVVSKKQLQINVMDNLCVLPAL